mmetsp:Transcript_15488/g.36593  ORF Transcript_15488/g.36593 Transcript_15488/m.36593 type:complete len:280 (-) Transcript_15488:900-1739(-)
MLRSACSSRATLACSASESSERSSEPEDSLSTSSLGSGRFSRGEPWGDVARRSGRKTYSAERGGEFRDTSTASLGFESLSAITSPLAPSRTNDFFCSRRESGGLNRGSNFGATKSWFLSGGGGGGSFHVDSRPKRPIRSPLGVHRPTVQSPEAVRMSFLVDTHCSDVTPPSRCARKNAVSTTSVTNGGSFTPATRSETSRTLIHPVVSPVTRTPSSLCTARVTIGTCGACPALTLRTHGFPCVFQNAKHPKPPVATKSNAGPDLTNLTHSMARSSEGRL